MHIKVLGPMTKQCELLLQNAAIAAKKLKCHAEFERVNDLRRVVAYGVMALPALVIDEKVVAGGSVLPVEEIMENYQTFELNGIRVSCLSIQMLY